MGGEVGEAAELRVARGGRVILGEAIGRRQSTSKRGAWRRRRAKGSQWGGVGSQGSSMGD